ncbi:hypothetical protein [Stakelama marina]|uniref:Uncharacterized protein n=1 Tax=Stakelama marina TaxID=2826939 RepID=A0A8T4IMQ3_9SPHN|nr:hypothetical protein [Stakelama marina]MBR0553436.1 hypothetical protein [Stakelama marina]
MRTAAAKRYTVRLAVTMIAYIGILFTVLSYIRGYDPQGSLRVLLSLLPALPVIGAIAVMGIYLIEETDEFIRARVAMSMLIGTGLVLSVATVLGFLQITDVVGQVEVFWAFPLWAIGWGLTQCVLNFRDSRAGGEA